MGFPKLKNDLLLRALKGETVERPPVWMMRQAGRFLPDYRILREKYTFFERCETPHLVSEITTMPIWQVGTDAAILFSDILVVPVAMGYHVDMVPGAGPRLPKTVKKLADAEAIQIPDVEEALGYVMEGIKQTRMDLKGEVPLIGFAGAPWTLLCYMVQGKGSKDFSEAKRFCFEQPEAAKVLLDKITDTTIAYMKAQINAGAQAFQLFDSWAGLLKEKDLPYYMYNPTLSLVNYIKSLNVPVICFPRGIKNYKKFCEIVKPDTICIDYEVDPIEINKQINIPVQGGMDPKVLLSNKENLKKETKKYLDIFKDHPYIFNLGHGVLPETDPNMMDYLVKTVKDY